MRGNDTRSTVIQVAPVSPIAVLLANVSGRSRGLAGAVAALGLGARLLVFATGVAVVREDARLATALGLASGAAYLALRAASSAARAEVEHDLYRATARALVDGDVLDVPSDDVQRVAWEGSYNARALVAATVPALASDVAASAVVAPIVAGTLPSRVAGAALAGAVVVAAALLLLRGIHGRLHARLVAASQRVNDALLVAIEGRLELVARGGEDDYAASFGAILREHRRHARRAAIGSAVLGRLPLALGVAVVALAAWLDAGARDAVAMAVMGQAVVLAAAAAPMLGAVMGAGEVTRLTPHTRAFAELLARPSRRERAARGGRAPVLPSTITADGVSFAYGDGRPDVLAGLSFEWAPGKALVLKGPNGSGKSTLLRLLLGLRRPTRGALRLGGCALDELDVVALRKDAALLPQRPYLGEPYASVRDAVRLMAPDAGEDAMRAALARAGLSVELDTPIGELSSGQRQRVALARVLLTDAKLVLLDEPDANLDREGIARVASLVGEMVAAGKMVAVAAHTSELAPPARVELSLDGSRHVDARAAGADRGA